MTDTPEHIAQKQFEILYAKPPMERFRMACEMNQWAWQMIENQIKKRYPAISLPDLKAQAFKLFYANDFPPEKLAQISQHIRAYWQQKEATII